MQKSAGAAAALEIELNEDALRINLLCTSRRRLEEVWEAQRTEAPDSDHKGLASLMDRPQLTEVDLLILASASKGQFRPLQEVLQEAQELARRNVCAVSTRLRVQPYFGRHAARSCVKSESGSRILRDAACPDRRMGGSVRLERRMSLARAAIILSLSPEHWKLPPGQEYVSELLGFFEKRINVSVSRGSLARMTITKTSPRLDLTELGTVREPADRLLDHLLERSDVTIDLDPGAFASNSTLSIGSAHGSAAPNCCAAKLASMASIWGFRSSSRSHGARASNRG
jgi:hypothetical protein